MDHADHPIGGMYLPSKAFMALIQHSGEGYYGDKSVAVLSLLIQQWVATTPAARCPWLDDAYDDERQDSAAEAAPVTPSRPHIQTDPSAAAQLLASLPDASASGPGLAPESRSGPAASRGYQWKQLFLPNGTELRAIYGGLSTYAIVEDEQIISDCGPTTPSRLANRKGCGTRNAWQTIWLRLPGSARWRRAAEYRSNH
jgi:hypothetical protein